MSAAIELHLPIDLRYVSLARLVVKTAARQAGMSEERLGDLEIAVSEAATNALRAHQHAAVDDPVVLRFGPRKGHAFEVEVMDAGHGFQPLEPAAFDDRGWESKDGGMGVTIIRNLTDDCEFAHADGMHVSMRFAVGLEAQAQV